MDEKVHGDDNFPDQTMTSMSYRLGFYLGTVFLQDRDRRCDTLGGRC